MQSLIKLINIPNLFSVILGKDLDRLRPNPRQIDNSLVKFVYSTDDDPGLLTFCDPPDAGDSESLKSFSKTSVLPFSLLKFNSFWLPFSGAFRLNFLHHFDCDFSGLVGLLLCSTVPICPRKGSTPAEVGCKFGKGEYSNGLPPTDF
jgi:hypothetical protein